MSLLLLLKKVQLEDLVLYVLDYIHNKRKKLQNQMYKILYFPDFFVDHDSSENQYKSIGMDAQSIEEKILNIST